MTTLQILQAFVDAPPWEWVECHDESMDQRCRFCHSWRGLPHMDECVWDNARKQLPIEIDKEQLLNDFHGLAIKWVNTEVKVADLLLYMRGER